MEKMTKQDQLLIQKQGGLCTLVIDNPEKKNLLTTNCLLSLAQALEDLKNDPDVRVVILRGSGEEAFSAGYDISALPTKPTGDLAESLKEDPPVERACRAVETFPYPVIAMLNGFAYGGGCELAVACDLRIAAEHVKMAMPPARLGLVYSYTGYRRFMTVLGFSRSMELFLTGRRYESRDCYHMGLVNHVVETRKLEPFTYDLGREISENAPLSTQGTKFALHKMAASPVLNERDEAMLRSLFVQSLQSEDMAEAKEAFLNKRKPRFKGK